MKKDKVMIDPTLLDEEQYDQHKIEESAEILLESEEIKKDSKLMEKIKEFWDQKGKKIKSLRDLKDLANNFSNDDNGEDDDD